MGASELNLDLGEIPFCGCGSQDGQVTGIFNRDQKHDDHRHSDYATWEEFCAANGWTKFIGGRGSGGDTCEEIMSGYCSPGGSCDLNQAISAMNSQHPPKGRSGSSQDGYVFAVCGSPVRVPSVNECL